GVLIQGEKEDEIRWNSFSIRQEMYTTRHRKGKRKEKHMRPRIRIALLVLFLLAAILLAVHFWPITHSGEVGNACPAAGTSHNTVSSYTSAHTPPPLYLGLDAYRHWDKLSY